MPNVTTQNKPEMIPNKVEENTTMETSLNSIPVPANIDVNMTPSTLERPSGKPVPGSLEWYEIRKENHKKVERKRRETINQAMLDLGAVVPGSEKNKSRILSRAVQHIHDLGEEIVALRSQVEQYRDSNKKYEQEVNELRALLLKQQKQ